MIENIRMLLAYKTWANQLLFENLAELNPEEIVKVRPTRWESIAYTLSHVWVVDDIFRHHLQGRKHGYHFRNLDARLALGEIARRQKETDRWLIDFATGLDDAAAKQSIRFEFVGGGDGEMTVGDILLHLVNHCTYHRGLISDMMYQIPAMPDANDLTIFLRDHWLKPTYAPELVA